MSHIQVQIGFADAMDKSTWDRVAHDPMAGTTPESFVIGARNQVVGVQIRIGAEQEVVLAVDRSNWLHPLGFKPRVRLSVRFPTLPASAVETLIVGYAEGDDRRLWMETLDRAGYAEVPASLPTSHRVCTRDRSRHTHSTGSRTKRSAGVGPSICRLPT